MPPQHDPKLLDSTHRAATCTWGAVATMTAQKLFAMPVPGELDLPCVVPALADMAEYRIMSGEDDDMPDDDRDGSERTELQIEIDRVEYNASLAVAVGKQRSNIIERGYKGCFCAQDSRVCDANKYDEVKNESTALNILPAVETTAVGLLWKPVPVSAVEILASDKELGLEPKDIPKNHILGKAREGCYVRVIPDSAAHAHTVPNTVRLLTVGTTTVGTWTAVQLSKLLKSSTERPLSMTYVPWAPTQNLLRFASLSKRVSQSPNVSHDEIANFKRDLPLKAFHAGDQIDTASGTFEAVEQTSWELHRLRTDAATGIQMFSSIFQSVTSTSTWTRRSGQEVLTYIPTSLNDHAESPSSQFAGDAMYFTTLENQIKKFSNAVRFHGFDVKRGTEVGFRLALDNGQSLPMTGRVKSVTKTLRSGMQDDDEDAYHFVHPVTVFVEYELTKLMRMTIVVTLPQAFPNPSTASNLVRHVLVEKYKHRASHVLVSQVSGTRIEAFALYDEPVLISELHVRLQRTLNPALQRATDVTDAQIDVQIMELSKQEILRLMTSFTPTVDKAKLATLTDTQKSERGLKTIELRGNDVKPIDPHSRVYYSMHWVQENLNLLVNRQVRDQQQSILSLIFGGTSMNQGWTQFKRAQSDEYERFLRRDAAGQRRRPTVVEPFEAQYVSKGEVSVRGMDGGVWHTGNITKLKSLMQAVSEEHTTELRVAQLTYALRCIETPPPSATKKPPKPKAKEAPIGAKDALQDNADAEVVSPPIGIQALCQSLYELVLRDGAPNWGKRTLVLLREDRGLAWVRPLLKQSMGIVTDVELEERVLILDAPGAFLKREASRYSSVGKQIIDDWNARASGDGPWVLVAGIKKWGTGFNFKAVQNEICDVPVDWIEWTQAAGRTVRLGAHASYEEMSDRYVRLAVIALLLKNSPPNVREKDKYRTFKLNSTHERIAGVCRPRATKEDKEEQRRDSGEPDEHGCTFVQNTAIGTCDETWAFEKYSMIALRQLARSRTDFLQQIKELAQYAVDAPALPRIGDEREPVEWLRAGVDAAYGLTAESRPSDEASSSGDAGEESAPATTADRVRSRGTTLTIADSPPLNAVRNLVQAWRKRLLEAEDDILRRSEAKCTDLAKLSSQDVLGELKEGKTRMQKDCVTYCQDYLPPAISQTVQKLAKMDRRLMNFSKGTWSDLNVQARAQHALSLTKYSINLLSLKGVVHEFHLRKLIVAQEFALRSKPHRIGSAFGSAEECPTMNRKKYAKNLLTTTSANLVEHADVSDRTPEGFRFHKDEAYAALRAIVASIAPYWSATTDVTLTPTAPTDTQFLFSYLSDQLITRIVTQAEDHHEIYSQNRVTRIRDGYMENEDLEQVCRMWNLTVCVIDHNAPAKVFWFNPCEWASFRPRFARYCSIGCVVKTSDAYVAVPMLPHMQLSVSDQFFQYHKKMEKRSGLQLGDGLLWKTFPMYPDSKVNGHPVDDAFSREHPRALYVQLWTYNHEQSLVVPEGSDLLFLRSRHDRTFQDTVATAKAALKNHRTVVVVISEGTQAHEAANFSYQIQDGLPDFRPEVFRKTLVSMQIDLLKIR
jgi:hypothetical protein